MSAGRQHGSAGGALRAWRLLRAAWPRGGCRGRVQGRAAAQSAIHACRDQLRRSLSATQPRRRGRKRAARGDRRLTAGCRVASCTRTWLGCVRGGRACAKCGSCEAIAALTRLRRTDEAISELRRAAELEPERARYAYVYAVGLHSARRADDAMTVLKRALARHPGDRDMLRGNQRAAHPYREVVGTQSPGIRLAKRSGLHKSKVAWLESLLSFCTGCGSKADRRRMLVLD